MLDAQRRLEDRYAALRDSRAGPVFFIEHGLSDVQIGELIAGVCGAVEVHPIDSAWWDAHQLSLIVAATEVGYRYRGSGTDFWPLLEKEFDAHVGGPARQRIRDRFAAAATEFRGAHPPATPWAQAFHLIAWPITHALVPLEFHRPLALTLASMRVNIGDLDDESLYRATRLVAASSSARFSTFLQSPHLVVSVVRNLLGQESGELSPEAIQRIRADLAADQLARRSLAVAQRVQRVVPRRGQAPAETSELVPPIKGALQLRLHKRALTLEASFPSLDLDPQRSLQLRRALRRRRFAPKLWGVTARVPAEQFLSGLPFAVRLAAAPSDAAPLLPELEGLDVDPELREILEAFELRLVPPVLFAIGADRQVARLVHGPSISGNRVYWVLALGVSSSLMRFPVIGQIGPYTCYELNPGEEDQRRALEELGYLLRFGISVAFAGAPPIDRDASPPVFVEGDQRVVVPRRPSTGLLVELDGTSIRTSAEDVVRVVVPEGEHLLRITADDETRDFSFSGVRAPRRSSIAACVINKRSPELTVQALMSGSLTFTIESFAPLQGLDLTVELHATDHRSSASAALGPLPQTVTSNQEPFTSLLDNAARELLLQSSEPRLRLQVGNLCTRDWSLESRLRPCWWERGSDGVELKSEFGTLPYGTVTVNAPHLPPTSEVTRPDREARLLAPMGLDTLKYGPAAAFTALCLAPKAVPLQAPVVSQPQIQRRRRGEHGTAGLEDLIEAYLRWALAESDTVTAEVRRRQITRQVDSWIVEACCGTGWRARESEISRKDSWDLLVDVGHDLSLGRDSYFDLPVLVWRQALEVAVATIRKEIPELWTLVRPPCDLTQRDWVILEESCDKAYQTVAGRYEALGEQEVATSLREADATADFDRATWQNAFDAVLAEYALAPVASLLLPTDTAPGMMALDPSEMSLDDLTDELLRWARDSHRALAGGVPAEDMLQAMVALWTDPEVAVTLEWRGALDTMLSDRLVARAARYLALRSRQVRGGAIA